MKTKGVFRWGLRALLLAAIGGGTYWGYLQLRERWVLEAMIERLSADSRIAEAMVTRVDRDPDTGKSATTIKFLEYDASGEPMEPRYFTFPGNLIQFQTLVVRFDDELVKKGDRLRGKSAYLFWKAFVLDGGRTKEFVLTPVNEIPKGYKVPWMESEFEKNLWERFWEYALDPTARRGGGVKSAQIEAPGSKFLPGHIYTLRIEHDGGVRIDAAPIPEIVKGELKN